MTLAAWPPWKYSLEKQAAWVRIRNYFRKVTAPGLRGEISPQKRRIVKIKPKFK